MNKLNESKEMYLESLLLLEKNNDSVRAIDLAGFMNFSRASVSRALLSLENDKLILRDKDEHISLTQKGLLLAEGVLEKHNILTEFFASLGVDTKIAEQDACRIEHVISIDTFDAIKKFLKKN